MKNKIVLMGYMASGKSTIAALLANKLNYEAIDLDDFIEQKAGIKVNDIFNQKGEIHFRKLESLFLDEILHKKDKIVLAVGGGTPCYANNIKIINKLATSVYIKLPISNLVERLKPERQQRPLVAHLNDKDLKEFVAKHLFERQNFYNQADIILPAQGLTPLETCKNILEKLA